MKAIQRMVLRGVIGGAVALGLVAGGRPVHADTVPVNGLVNYETPQVHPLDLTPDGGYLLAVNTAANALEVFSLIAGVPVHQATIPVGMDPVSVRARSATEVWVVNQVSDSVSVVDLTRWVVVATLSTDNEPADVVFAEGVGRAFVSCADANRLNVFDLNQLNEPARVVPIAGEEPRALAVSPDGRRVYAGIFESGNGTTVLHGRAGTTANVVSRTDGPHAGKNPPPNSGSAYVPAMGPGVGTPPPVSLIVRKRTDGRWLDDNQGDWTPFVTGELAPLSGRVEGWDLPDHDVAVVDTTTLEVTYQKSLMTTVMALAVNPASGQLSVVGTEARNEIRWEPNLNGRFLRVNVALVGSDGNTAIADLNPHLTYTTSTVPAAVRSQSLGDPRGVAWRADGQSALITGMGSNSVAVIDATGQRVAHFPVGEGPTGVVVHEQGGRGYVLNRFGGSISVIDLAATQETARVAFYDPTPAAIKAGRPFLYNTHRTSGLGHVSCASCHVDGRTDRLTWDLGDPGGANTTVANASNATGAPTGGRVAVSAMKGPMTTQTLQDIGKHPTLHWRGDKGTLADFNGAFVSLLGAEAPLSASDMAAFRGFLDTIHLPPNPHRKLDNSRPSSVTLPDGSVVRSATMNSLRGQNTRNNNCLQCHLGGGTRNRASNLELGQAFVAPSLALFYKKLGYWPASRTGSTSGTGFFHDGVDSVLRAARVNTAETQPDMLAEIMSLEGPGGPLTGAERRQDTHAGAGRQLTLNGPATTAQSQMLSQFISIAVNSPHASLIAHTRLGGITRGFYLTEGSMFQSDRTTERLTVPQMLTHAATVDPVTFMLVPQGTAFRLGVDKDGDGALDRDGLTLVSPGPQTAALVSTVVLAMTATTSSPPIVWSATGLPNGLSIHSSTGVISGSPIEPGLYSVAVTARDSAGRIASQNFSWSIDAPQNAPEPGLAAEYYAGRQLNELRLTRIDPELNMFWPGDAGPGPNVPGDEFSARWTGRLLPAFSESHVFVVDCDDGVRMWVDGQLVLNQWDGQPGTHFGLTSQPVFLTAGRWHDIRVEMQDFYSDALLVLRWQSASQPRQVVPAIRLARPAVTDSTPPTVSLTTPNLVVPGPFAVVATFNELVTGLSVDDFEVTNGSVTELVGVGSVQTALITPSSPGAVTVALPAGRVTDAVGLPNEAAVPLSVVFEPPVANRPPTILVPPAQSSTRGSAVHLGIEATDPDGQNLLFSASGLPSGLVINASTGLISGIVLLDAAPAQDVTVTVTDGSATAAATFSWVTGGGSATAAGLRGDYFAGSQFEQLVTTRSDAHLSHYWPAETAPAPGVPGDGFSVRWTGRLLPAFSETHQFVVNADDGVRLWVGGQLIIDQWNPPSGTYFGLQSAPIALTAGQPVDLRVELQDFFSDAWLEVYWVSPSQPLQPVPPTRLFPPGTGEIGGGSVPSPRLTGLRAVYFVGSLGTPVTERVDPNVNFAWGLGSPARGVPADQFSARWTGWLWPAATGDHEMELHADDKVRLWINDQLVIDAWTEHETPRRLTGNVSLTTGVPAKVKLEYFDHLGVSRIEWAWAAAGMARHVIPQERLSPEAVAPIIAGISEEESAGLAATRTPAVDIIARSALPVVGSSLRLETDPQGGWFVGYELPPGLDGSIRLESSGDCRTWSLWPDAGSHSFTVTGAQSVRVGVPGATADGPPRQFFRVRFK